MGVYCSHLRIARHAARAGEILEVRRLSVSLLDPLPVCRRPRLIEVFALFGDNEEIACIPHAGCRLEILAAGESWHREVNLLQPGQVLRYRRSFLFGDRFELPRGATVSLQDLVGVKLRLAPKRPLPPLAETTGLEKEAQGECERVTMR